MPPAIVRLSLGVLAPLTLAACNKTDTAPRPEHSDVATAMPDAASTPGAIGPATAPPKTSASKVPTTPADNAPPPVNNIPPPATSPTPSPK